MTPLDPLFVLFLALVLVIGLISIFRIHPFLALISAAFFVSFLSGIDSGQNPSWPGKVQRVGLAFGTMAGKISILIAMGTIIGKCMTESGAADKIVQTICRLIGEKRLASAMLGGGFVLSIPVFYDATFYLLLPLAKSIHRITKRHYLLYLLCIGFGATISHGLIPPTPGPLVMSQQLNVSLGMMILLGLMVGACMAPCALGIAHFINWYLPNPKILDENGNEISSENVESKEKSQAAPSCSNVDSKSELSTESQDLDRAKKTFDNFVRGESGDTAGAKLPSFWAAFLPIILPVILIATGATIDALEKSRIIEWTSSTSVWRNLFALLGNSEVALILSALSAVLVYASVRRPTLRLIESKLGSALESAGIIILITSAGGAFGAMLRASGVGERIQDLTGTGAAMSGPTILLIAFGITALIKTAQGSSTTAMITVSGIFAAMNLSPEILGFHVGYLAVAIGIGAMVTGWMNDSGFCIFSRMGGISETDALKTWTVGLTLLGLCGLGITLVLSTLFPFPQKLFEFF